MKKLEKKNEKLTKKVKEVHEHNFVFGGKREPGYDYSGTFLYCSKCGATINVDR